MLGEFYNLRDALGGVFFPMPRGSSDDAISDAGSFNVLDYGAVLSEAVDSTAAFQATLAAALLADAPVVVFPPGVYMVQDPTAGAHVDAADGPIWIDPDFRDLLVTGYGATIKIGPNGVGSSVVRIFGSNCRVEGLTIDCNVDVAPLTKDNSAFEINGTTTGSIGSVEGINGCDNDVVDCVVKNGHKDDPDVTQGENHFVCLNGYRNRFINCKSYDCAWSAFLIGGGGGNAIDHSRAIGHRGNGLRVQGEMESIFVHRFYSRSTINSGRHSVLIDPASSGASSRCRLAYFSECDLYCNPTVNGDVPQGDGLDGSATTFKLAAVDVAIVRDSYIGCGTGLSNRSWRIEDVAGKVLFDGCKFDGPGGFGVAAASGSSIYQGAPSGQASNGGFVQFTLGASHGLIVGKSLYVSGSAIGSYNREHVITAVDATTVTTNITYTAGALGANIWAHSCCDEFHANDCEFHHQLTAGGSYHIFEAYARIFDLEECRFFALQASSGKLTAIGWNMASDIGSDLVRLVGVKFAFNSTNIVKGFRPLDETKCLTSGKTIGLRNSIVNYAGGTALLIDINASGDGSSPYPNRATLFNSDGDRTGAYLAAAVPTGSDVAFIRGDHVRNTAPSAGGTPGWVCTTTGSVGVSVGTFGSEAVLT